MYRKEIKVTNPQINYKQLIQDTVSTHYNVHDRYKKNTFAENVDICEIDKNPFSVGVINVTGDLNVGMMLRTACLLGAKNFYIFGRKKFDKRSTVGADKYMNIVQYTFNDPLSADDDIYAALKTLSNTIVLCDQGGGELSESNSHIYNMFPREPLFLFGSESHGLPECLTTSIKSDLQLFHISIPQWGVLRSFNVSAAMSIVCWDYVKEMCL